MILDEVLKWFENNIEVKPADLPDDVSLIIRLGHTGELALSADFMVRFYCLHLKKLKMPLPKGPAGYDEKFIDDAINYFSYVGVRCIYTHLKKQGIVSYEDSNDGIFDSDIQKELKAEITEQGKEFFEKLRKSHEEQLKKQQENSSTSQLESAQKQNQQESSQEAKEPSQEAKKPSQEAKKPSQEAKEPSQEPSQELKEPSSEKEGKQN